MLCPECACRDTSQGLPVTAEDAEELRDAIVGANNDLREPLFLSEQLMVTTRANKLEPEVGASLLQMLSSRPIHVVSAVNSHHCRLPACSNQAMAAASQLGPSWGWLGAAGFQPLARFNTVCGQHLHLTFLMPSLTKPAANYTTGCLLLW
jgi:hypothetical protein